jgi:uncharacterized protein
VQHKFEWNSDKARSNLRKHKISFERETEIFLDPLMLTIADEEHSEAEERWITVGDDRNDVPLVVIHTFREVDSDSCVIRIISSRRATKNERNQYSQR